MKETQDIAEKYLEGHEENEELQSLILKRINGLFANHSLTYQEFAQITGLSINTVHNLTYRKSVPNLPTIMKICKGFGISLSDFFSDMPSSEIRSITDEEYRIVVEYRLTKAIDRDRLLIYWAGLNGKMPEEIIPKDF